MKTVNRDFGRVDSVKLTDLPAKHGIMRLQLTSGGLSF